TVFLLASLPACSPDDPGTFAGRGSETDSGDARADTSAAGAAGSGGTGAASATDGGGGIGLVPTGTGGRQSEAGSGGTTNGTGSSDAGARLDATRDGGLDAAPVDCSPVSTLPV